MLFKTTYARLWRILMLAILLSLPAVASAETDSGLSCLSVYIADASGSDTHIRNAPGGASVLRLPAGGDYMLEVCQPSRGWWRIHGHRISAYTDQGEGDWPLPRQGSHWVHYSVLAMGSRNYGGETLTLYAAPSTTARVVYQFRETLNLRPLSRQNAWVQVETEDQKHRGWIQLHWLCGNALTTCV